jgi:DNA-binding MarR family transcriptional regulator
LRWQAHSLRPYDVGGRRWTARHRCSQLRMGVGKTRHFPIACASKYNRRMDDIQPFTPTEEALWRAFMRLTVTIPRALNDDLVRRRAMTAVEYKALMFLSEAPNQQMRISDLAATAALSLSRMSRLLDGLQTQELVVKRPSESDGRGALACLTRKGMSALRAAWPDHLATVRRLVMDRLDENDKAALARILAAVAANVDDQAKVVTA